MLKVKLMFARSQIKGTRQWKDMQDRLSRVISTLPRSIGILCNCRRGRPDSIPIRVPVESFIGEKATEDPKLMTWPADVLTNTIGNVVKENVPYIEESLLISLNRVLEGELNDKCPFTVEDQYDFSVICSAADWEEAKKITRDFEEKFGLRGYVIWDSLTLGQEQFDIFEEIVERSTRVIFYITDNFTNDNFCCHLARNTFAGNNDETKKKSVPLMDKVTSRVQDELLLVNKLTMDNPHHIELRFPAVFSGCVKLEKDVRRREIEVDLDRRRVEFLREIWESKYNELLIGVQ